MSKALHSDVQGLVNPPRVKGRGKEGQGQGKDFMTLNNPLTLLKGHGFFRAFSGLFQGFLKVRSFAVFLLFLELLKLSQK